MRRELEVFRRRLLVVSVVEKRFVQEILEQRRETRQRGKLEVDVLSIE